MVGIDARQPYVDGKFVPGEGPELSVCSPATEEKLWDVETCSLEQTEAAILAAKRTFDSGEWANAPRVERTAAVSRLADYFAQHGDDVQFTVASETGGNTANLAMGAFSAAPMRQAAELYLSLPEQEFNPRPISEIVGGGKVGVSVNVYRPVGVVSAISAYNAPMWINTWKVIPALLTGCSLILRPSPFTPVSALAFAEAADAAGIPPGVLNVVVEDGFEGSRLMTTHPAVDQVTFTGSTQVGRQVMTQAAGSLKRVHLELGGKSVQLYLPDAVDRAPMGVMGVFAVLSGQACVAPTRMLVPQESKAGVLEAAKAVAEQATVGDPSAGNVVGPLISEAQVQKCERYVAAAVEAGATVVTGGKRTVGLEKGHYFEPTILDLPDNSNPAAQDEIFGPVICVIGYRDLDDAVRIANDSVYGLSGQVFGNNVAEATAVASRIRTGNVNINGHMASSAYTSSGGHKQSGLGRERGVEGIRAFQQITHLVIGTL